ncbi:MAG: alpha/beta hydrolase-fold protein [Ginsengibacter sp.]
MIINITYSQFKVTFVVKQFSIKHTGDTLFVAGNFNDWDPDNKEYALAADKDGIASITLSLSPGNYEYKFTRGDWAKAEAGAAGNGASNRKLHVPGDTIIHVEIPAWADEFSRNNVLPRHTLSENVKIIDTAFYMPQLDRSRRVWLYLPTGYFTSEKKYPVLYMHDGQNLFDEATSYAGEWGVDEFLDSIFSSGKKEVIVVGIDNGLQKRMTEYNPYSYQKFGKGEGDEYVDFLVKDLKPYIDKHYHTLPDKKNTYIAGSSMGGLISLYAVLKYPDKFGGAGIFSPAFWTASGIDGMVLSYAKSVNSRLFFYAGAKEGKSMLPDMHRIAKEIRKHSPSPLKEVVDPQAMHNEAAWRKYFPQFYEWVLLEK